MIGASGDFNGDGNTDLVWRDMTTGSNVIWLMDGVGGFSSLKWLPPATTNWVIGASGDFNGDGNMDLVWRDTTTGNNLVWLVDGTVAPPSVSVKWLPAATTDWEIGGPK